MTFNLAALLFTPQVKAGTQPAALQSQALSGGTGIFATAPGGEFFDLLLGNTDGTETALLNKKPAKGKETLLTVPALENHGDPLSAEILVAADEILSFEAEAEGALDLSLFSEVSPETPATDALIPENVSVENTAPLPDAPFTVTADKKFAALLEHLLAGIPAESRPEIVTLDRKTLNEISKNLEFNPAAEGDDAAATLIATGLTPEKITQFMEELAKRAEAGESFIVGLVKILPPQAKRDIIFLPRAVLMPQVKAGKAAQTDNAEGVIAPATTEAAQQTQAPAGEIDLSTQLNDLVPGGEEILPASVPADGETGFERLLKLMEGAQQQPRGNYGQAVNNNMQGAEKAAPAAKAHSPVLSTVPGNAATLPDAGLDFAAALSGEVYPDGLDWAQHRQEGGAVHSLHLNGPAMMTSLVNHSTQAGQTHPSTQIVATAVTKAAAEGETKSFTLKLEPPELGRIEIRMEFAKDKSLKAHMIVEKQETYLMLHRDAHALERALNNAGLEADGSSLSFELAQDGNLFDHDQRGGGGNNASGGGDAGGDDDAGIEIIETTMTWSVDAETGLTRYDILA